MRVRCITAAAWMVVLLGLYWGNSAGAEPPEEKTWSDEICSYKLSPPLDGYFVPRSVFENGYDIKVSDVLAESRRMTEAELDAYTEGGKLHATRDYPLLVFKNHGVNIFLWKGGYQVNQPRPRYWDGSNWSTTGGAAAKQSDIIECLFYQPPGRERCYVMLQQWNGQVGGDRIDTEYVRFAAFPPVEAVLRKAIDRATAVVYRPSRADLDKGELLDCLKGQITLSELQRLPGAEQVRANTFIFVTGAGVQRKVLSTYREGRIYGSFQSKYGRLGLSVSQVSDAVAKDPSLSGYVWPGPLRWELARAAARPRRKDAVCQLRVVNPKPARGEWVVVEISVGRDQPGLIYQQPQRRSQQDGGGALVKFRVRQGDVSADLAPRGRFGSDSLQKAAPEEAAALGIEYQFIDCGQGVLKLAMRPKRYPWSGVVEGRCMELAPRLNREELVTHVSDAVQLNLQ